MIRTINLNYLPLPEIQTWDGGLDRELFLDNEVVYSDRAVSRGKKGVSAQRQVPKAKFYFDYFQVEPLHTSYSVIQADRQPTCSKSTVLWDSWALVLVDIIGKSSEMLAKDIVALDSLQQIADAVPDTYGAFKARLANIDDELSCSDEEKPLVSFKSFVSFLRFVPAFQEKIDDIGFYLNADTKRLGLTLSRRDSENKTLDILFKEDGEIFFSYMEESDGFSRISGSSYLTEYLSNSCKIKKILNIFDY